MFEKYSGGKLFDKLPFEIETSYSKNGRDGVIKTRRTVADEFAESTAFYRDLSPAERKLFFGTEKLGYGAIGESLKNRLEANGITRFSAADGTVDFEAVISEFRRQWSNFERGSKFLKERAEAQGERDRAQLEDQGWITDDAEGQARLDAERASAEQGGINPVTGLPRVSDEHGEISFRRKITSQRPEDYDKENGTQLAQIVDYTNAIDAHDTARKDKHLHKHYVLANTSDFLRGLGIKGTHFTISSNGIKRHHGKNAAHSISTDEWIGISYSLSHERPLAVFKYSGEGGTRQNAYRIWTRAEIAGRMAVVGVEVKSNGREMYVNAVDTIFGAEKINAKKELRLYPKSEQEFQSVLDGLNSRKYPETPAGGERTRADASATDGIVSNSGAPRQGGDNGIRYSVGGIFTGTAADYANRSRQGGKDDGPTLVKVGTGEGSQVYGWGLYGSTVRGVAENCMPRERTAEWKKADKGFETEGCRRNAA